MKAIQKRLKCTKKLYLGVDVGASTTPGGGRGSDAGGYKETNRRKNDNPNIQKNSIKDAVNKRLGLTSVPNTPPPGVPRGDKDSDTSMIAMNLKGNDRFMYGREASKFTDDEMVKRGLVKEGNYFRQDGGNFIRISKEEGRKLYAAGDKSISRSVSGNTSALNLKYGSSNGAMGSGDPGGVMSSIPLSREMLKSQNKFKGLVVGALSLGMPGIGATAMRADAAVALKDAKQSGAAYDDYTKKFDATQKGKKFTSQRNTSGIIQLGLSKGKDKLGEVFGN